MLSPPWLGTPMKRLYWVVEVMIAELSSGISAESERNNCQTIKKMALLNCELSPIPFPANTNLARLFMHGGHTNHLADFSWNQNEPWVVCSAAEDNLIQIWKVAEAIVGKDIEEPSLDELER